MDENEVVVVEDLLSQALCESFEAVSDAKPGSEERKRLHDERVDLIRLYFEEQKIFENQSKDETRNEEERKKARFDKVMRALEVAGKIGGIGMSTFLALKLFAFAEQGHFMQADQEKAVGWLYNLIGKL